MSRKSATSYGKISVVLLIAPEDKDCLYLGALGVLVARKIVSLIVISNMTILQLAIRTVKRIAMTA